jgi:DNA mismatch repair protein MutS
MTGMGSRLLKRWLLEPQRDRSRPSWRLPRRLRTARRHPGNACARQLKGTSDVERITARIALRQVRPRELVALRVTLQKSEHCSPQCTHWVAGWRAYIS